MCSFIFNLLLHSRLLAQLNNRVTKKKPINLLLILLFAVFFIANPAHSATKGMDIALVLDTSGSMKKNDPNQLRIQAAKLFVSLLSRQDKVSLVGFSSRAYPITPLLSLNSQKNERKLRKAIDNMATNGQFTNLHDAILSGYELLEKQKNKNRTRQIILMSDGKMDLGNNETNLRLLEKTLEELAPKLLAKDIKLHTIAFTESSYIPILKLAAEDTDGQFILLKNADGIHQVFENIFERTKKPEMLPINNESFIIDKNVDEVTIIASKFSPKSIVMLQSPDGEEYSKTNHSSNVKWFKAKKFDLITIKKPANGYWLIKYSEGGSKAYIVSDMYLDATTTKKKAEPDAPLHIQAQLIKNKRRIKNKKVLDVTKFMVKVTSPTGAVIENELVDDGSEIGSERGDGIYGISYAFEKQGPYKVEVTAISETFDRKKTLFIDVKAEFFKTPFEIQQDIISQTDILDSINQSNHQSPEPIVADSTTSDKSNNAHEDTSSQHAGASDHNDDHKNESNNDRHSDNDKHGNDKNLHEKLSQQNGNSHDKKDDHETSHNINNEHDEELTPEELEAKSHFGIKDAVIAFSAFNGFLLALGGGYYYWYRRQQKKKAKGNDNDEKDNDKKDSDSTEKNSGATTETESSSDIELEAEEDLNTSISDVELENELSSILDNEKNDN